ncbi:hypothetical protein [Propionibacterium acidifaciens]
MSTMDTLPIALYTVKRLMGELGLDGVITITARRDRLDERITAMAADSPWTDTVHRLGCLRGYPP